MQQHILFALVMDVSTSPEICHDLQQDATEDSVKGLPLHQGMSQVNLLRLIGRSVTRAGEMPM